MEHDTHLLSRSYQLIEHSGTGLSGNCRVAEEHAEYTANVANADDTANAFDQCSPGAGADTGAAPATASTTETESAALTEHHRQGQTLHLGMALIEGVQLAASDRQANAEKLRTLTQRATGRRTQPTPDSTDTTDTTDTTDEALIERLQQLVRANDRNMAEQLALYLQIDQRELWRKVGCRDFLHWMDRELGINRNAAYERLRAARALPSLPVIESLFALGKLGWSKVRELTRVATPANEQELAAAALELGASETLHLCQRWRHADVEPGSEQHTDSPDEQEAAQAAQAWRKRSLSWRPLSGKHTTRITLDLPTDSAAEFLNALEAMEESDTANVPEPVEQPENAPPANTAARTPRQRRADAMLLMSTKALAHAGPAVATADRYRVLVTIDSRMLGADASVHRTAPGELPPERPAIQGFGPIAVATAQRLASQARLTVVATDAEGEVVATGRDTRLFSASTTRALIARDRCCQMPGCTQSRAGWLHAHHVIPWAHGGESTLGNAALLCSACHVRLHEGGLKLERVDKRSVALPEHELLSLTTEEQAIARAKVAAVQRFRLLRGDGSWVAGPRLCDQQDHPTPEDSPRGDSGREGGREVRQEIRQRVDREVGQEVLPPADNINVAHWGNRLERYRV